MEDNTYSRAYVGDATDKLDITLANLNGEIGGPVLYIVDVRYQAITVICDAINNTLTAEPNYSTATADEVIFSRFLGLSIFLFVVYLMFLLVINIGDML